MTYFEMGSDESHFNVSLIVRDKVTRPYPQTTTVSDVNHSCRRTARKENRTQVVSLPPPVALVHQRGRVCVFNHFLHICNRLHLDHANATPRRWIVQELCESRGGRPGLSVLKSLLVSVDVKIY